MHPRSQHLNNTYKCQHNWKRNKHHYKSRRVQFPTFNNGLEHLNRRSIKKERAWGFPGDTVDKNHLAMQGTWVWSLAQEDPTCHGATGPMHHDSWAWALKPASHTTKPTSPEPTLHNKSRDHVGRPCAATERSPHSLQTRESPRTARDPVQPKTNPQLFNKKERAWRTPQSNHMLTDRCRTFYPTRVECMFSSSTHRSFPWIAHTLGSKNKP